MRTEKQKQYNKQYYHSTAFNLNYHKRWTIEEDLAVILHHIPDSELCTIIGRSVGSIQRRRNRIKENPEKFEISVKKYLKIM